MDSILSVQDKDFTGDGTEFTKVSRAARKAESHFTLAIIGIWQMLVKIYHGIIEPQHLVDPRQMVSLKEWYDKVKEGTSAELFLQSGLG